MKKRFSLIALVAVFALIVAACSSDTEDTTTTTAAPAEEEMVDTTVLDLAVEAGQFSTLIAAIDAAGLGETLEGEGPFTPMQAYLASDTFQNTPPKLVVWEIPARYTSKELN